MCLSSLQKWGLTLAHSMPLNKYVSDLHFFIFLGCYYNNQSVFTDHAENYFYSDYKP